ncbi:MAG: zinc-ribbon domain containing protein [Desulfotomaculaceae bacterium]
MYQDRNLTCRDCGEEFVFTVSEQEFFAEKGFHNDPSRCNPCRAARKNRNNRPNNNSGGGYQQNRQMHPAVCSNCGKETEVPFKPSGERPVYCRDCFRRVSSY